MRPAIATLLSLSLTACGSDVIIQAGPTTDDGPPTIPEPLPDDPPDEPTDPPMDPPEPAGCPVEVTIEQIAGTQPCEYGGVSNLAPATLLATKPAPAVDGLRFELQGCPAGGDCVCAVTVACVGSDIAALYTPSSSIYVQAWIQPDELILGHPGPWECIDCGYGPPFFHAASKLVDASAGGTIDVAAGVVTGVETTGGTVYETHALDGTAYQIGGLAPVQIPLGSATANEGQTMALVMDDDLLALSLRNLRSTWCIEGCNPDDPTLGSADWVIFGPINWDTPGP